MTQLILHLIGDYVTQSDWMAQNKAKSTWAAFCHATVYSLPFLLIGSLWAFLVIWSTHLLIDRFRLARFVVWAKNIIFSGDFWAWACAKNRTDRLWSIWPRFNWSNCSSTGYPSDAPPWLAVWLLIAADNTLHLAINALSLHFL
jgi:hypothetical protein